MLKALGDCRRVGILKFVRKRDFLREAELLRVVQSVDVDKPIDQDRDVYYHCLSVCLNIMLALTLAVQIVSERDPIATRCARLRLK